MLIRIDHALPEPLYAQIRACVIEGIAKGQLQPGDVLPSVRSLASDLGVNLHTVHKAYGMLRDEGRVVALGRAGVVVADSKRDSCSAHVAATQERCAEALYRIALESKAAGLSEAAFKAVFEEQMRRAYEQPAGENTSLGSREHGEEGCEKPEQTDKENRS